MPSNFSFDKRAMSRLEAEIKRRSEENIRQSIRSVERTHAGAPLADVKRELVRQLKLRDITLTWPDPGMEHVAQQISDDA